VGAVHYQQVKCRNSTEKQSIFAASQAATVLIRKYVVSDRGYIRHLLFTIIIRYVDDAKVKLEAGQFSK